MGCHSIYYRHSNCLVCHAQVAAEFLVQNQFNLVDFYPLRIGGVRNCAADRELAELAGCNKKPG